MRNALNDIEKIERYLRNEMSSEEKSAFEKEMQSNPELKKSVEEQQQLMKGMERIGMKKAAAKAGFKYRLQKGLINVGIPVLITAAITALVINWSTSPKNEKRKIDNKRDESKISYTLPILNENGDSLWTDADKYIPYQIYSIDNSRDTIIEGDQGTILAIPANSFVDENGNVVKGKIDFELKEALNTETILKGGLTTTSNGELLETGGMFYLNARQDGKSLKLAEGKNIIADVPSDNTKTGMMLFDGERKVDGTINWVNPKPIEKPLVPVDIHTLNFYPPKYEDSLAAMTEKASIKKYKDSLYYSFAGKFGNEKWKSVNFNEVENVSVGGRAPVEIVDVGTNPNNNNNNNSISYTRYIMYRTEEGFTHQILNSKGDERNGHGMTIELLRKNNEVQFLFHIQLNKNTSIVEIKFTSNNSIFCKPINYLGAAESAGNKTFDSIQVYSTYVNSDRDISFAGSISYSIYTNQNGIARKFSYNLDCSTIINKSNPKYYSPCSDMIQIDSVQHTFSGLNPAKVKAIWSDKFQNTLIATKEFEERMPYIHGLCSRGNNVLDIYVKNIDKRISTIDSMVAQTLSGSDKETFLKFAARGEGRVKMNNRLLQKLGNYYERQTELFMKAAKKTRDEYYLKNEQKNTTANKKANNHNKKELERESKNFQKEFMINLKNAYRQVGKKLTFGSNGRVRLSVGTTGWKNLDAYVLEATVNRTTMNYTDPQTGKTAVLEYKPFSVQINDYENYDRVLVYLLPNQLNSFMRMKNDGGTFKENLNMLFQHELVILAYKGDESYFKHYKEIEPGELKGVVLDKMDESKIRTRLFSLNRMAHSEEMKREIVYQFFLQADTKRRKLFLEKEKFIQRIEKVIFPCGNYDLDRRSEEITE